MSEPREPEPLDPASPRYAPERPLPDRRYLPGLMPHPHDLEGRAPEAPLGSVDPASCGASEHFRFGVDLLNRAYFWEAHEAWETLWNALPREAPEREAIQGLIQLAAALLKEHLGVASGARKLSRTSREKLERAHALGCSLPIDLEDLVRRSRAHFEPLFDAKAPPAPRPSIRLRS